MTSRKLPKGAKIENRISTKLKSLVRTDEYQEVVALLGKMDQDGTLDFFLSRIEGYWDRMDVFTVEQSESTGGPGILNTVREDWLRIWPTEAKGDPKAAFTTCLRFWKRLDQSRVLEDTLQEVLPDLKKGYTGDSGSDEDAIKLGSMGEERRNEEVLNRLLRATLVAQFNELMVEESQKVQSISPKIATAGGRLFAIMERKVANRKDVLGGLFDFGVYGVLLIFTLIALSQVAGLDVLPKLPSWITGEEEVVIASSDKFSQVVSFSDALEQGLNDRKQEIDAIKPEERPKTMFPEGFLNDPTYSSDGMEKPLRPYLQED